MATISFTLSASDLTTVVDALSTRFGYSATLPDGSANPQTKGEFVRLRIARWVRDQVHEHQLKTAQNAVVVTDVDLT